MVVSEGVGGNCCYFLCFRRFSEGLKKARRGKRDEEEQDGAIFVDFKGF